MTCHLFSDTWLLLLFDSLIPVRICANAYLRVILSAGCLGPNTSRRKAVRLHRMPRKQKAAITLSSKMV